MNNFKVIYDKVMKDLENWVPDHFTYHDAAHTRYVLDQAVTIAAHENITGRDLLLVKIAALYHDIGFLEGRHDHEALSCTIARDDLTDSFLTAAEVEKVCGMIRATQIPQEPKNLLEQIVADADLEYLGTNNFEKFAGRLYRELSHFDPNISPRKWDEIQIDFLTKHTYHTNFCKQNREPVKQQNLEMVKERLMTCK